MKVVIMESLSISDELLAKLEAPFIAKGCSFVSYPRTGDKAKLIEEAKDAEAMILANMPMPADVLRACPKLKFVNIAFTGVDHVGLEAAREKNMVVSNASGYSNEAVAELCLGMALSLLRKMREVETRCRNGGDKSGLMGSEINGKTVGIIGLGKIGTRTAELFHAFGAKLIAHSRTQHKDAPSWIKQVSFEDLLKQSDIVSLHCPINDSSRGMINAKALSMMKKTAILINAARGPVVVSKDLAEALNAGKIAAAGIDVFDKEPPLDKAEALLSAKNTLLTPHVAFATEESMVLRAGIVFDNLKAWMDGKPQNLVK